MLLYCVRHFALLFWGLNLNCFTFGLSLNLTSLWTLFVGLKHTHTHTHTSLPLANLCYAQHFKILKLIQMKNVFCLYTILIYWIAFGIWPCSLRYLSSNRIICFWHCKCCQLFTHTRRSQVKCCYNVTLVSGFCVSINFLVTLIAHQIHKINDYIASHSPA